MRVCNLMLQNALSWLRQGCCAPWLRAKYYCLLQLDFVSRSGMAASRLRYSDLLGFFFNFETGDFPFKNPFTKCFKFVVFLFWRRDPVLELQFLTPLRIVLLWFATEFVQIAM